MSKGLKLLCTLGAGALAAVAATLYFAVAFGNLPEPCTLGELWFVIRRSGFGTAFFAFALVGSVVWGLCGKYSYGQGRRTEIDLGTSRPLEVNTNGSIMTGPSIDATGHIRGDTRI